MYKCETSFKAWGKAGQLNSDDIMQGLFQRLPYRVRAKFVSLNNQGEDSGTFEELRELIESAASETDSSYGKLMQQKKTQKPGFQATRHSQSVCAAVQQSKDKSSWSGSEVQQSKNKSCGSGSEVQVCVVCKGKHDLKSCPTFLNKSVQERKQVVREGRLCFNCLRKGHRIAECRSKLTCHQCGRKHNTLLHFQANESADHQEKSPSTLESSASGNQPAESVLSASTSSKQGNRTVRRTIFKVVPVKVWFSDPSECTYAFIDEGSSVNLCGAGLAKRLGIPISHESVELHTTNAVTVVNKKIHDLAIQGIEESSAFNLKEALIMDEIVDVSASIPTEKLAHQYEHHKDIVFPEVKERKVELLLGSDLHQAYQLQDVRIGAPGDPSGLHTFLGWTIYGTDKGNRKIKPPRMMVNFLDTDENLEVSCERILKCCRMTFRILAFPKRCVLRWRIRGLWKYLTRQLRELTITTLWVYHGRKKNLSCQIIAKWH